MKNYDPRTIVLSWQGFVISGFMDGDFITIERNEDSFSPAVGSIGDVTRVRSLDKTGNITFTLKAESDSNAFLSSQMVADEATGAAYGPVVVEDLNGNSLYTSENAWLAKPADVTFSNDASGREWTLQCDKLEMSSNGAAI